jgi:asparagine synthase (glutamine-hydrolysing)
MPAPAMGATTRLAERAAIAGVWQPGQRMAPVVDADACFRDGAPIDWSSGIGSLGDVDGAFALAWTDAEGRLHLARDAIGQRSLYWGRAPSGGIAWGTRLHDVLAAGVERRLDPVAVTTFLTTAYVPGSATLVAGIRAVPAGVELIFGQDAPGATSLPDPPEPPEPVARPFWTLPATPDAFEDEHALRERLRATLEDAVARALPDGPLGAFLSGGIDSSLVVALACKRRPVHAFSISFGPEHRNELEWSSAVAAHTGAGHQVVLVRPEDVTRRLDETVGALSEPNGDPLTVPNLMMFEAAASAGLPVVVNGEGGDPCFGGPKNSPMLLSELYGDTSREEAYLRAHQKMWDELDQALEPDFAARIPAGALEALVSPWFEDPRWPSYLERLLAINVSWKGAGHILPKVEHLGGRMGVRARSPLFDRRVVELAFAIPAGLKRRGSIEKYLLKEAVRDLLPAAVVERPKSGMMVPVEGWFTGPLSVFARERLLDGLAPRRIVRRDYLERLVARQLPGLRPRQGVKIWLLLTLESWLRTVYDGAR